MSKFQLYIREAKKHVDVMFITQGKTTKITYINPKSKGLPSWVKVGEVDIKKLTGLESKFEVYNAENRTQKDGYITEDKTKDQLTDKYLNEKTIRIPDLIALGIDGSTNNQQQMARASAIGGMNAIDTFNKMGVTPLTVKDFNVVLKNEEIHIKLTPQGMRTVRTRLRDDDGYLRDITKAFESAYKKYFGKIQ